jgi:Mg/Co/Ni transporter MgtE
MTNEGAAASPQDARDTPAGGLTLASAFVEQEPEAAARALEELPSEDAALFLAELPPAIAAPVIDEMSPGSAARRLALLEPARAAAFLEAVGSRACVSILRVCAPEPRRAILPLLPPRLVQHFRRSLAYTLDTVGAWIEYDVPTLPAHRTVREALQVLRLRAKPEDSAVFVLRAAQFYGGTASFSALLRADADAPLSRVMQRGLRPLSDAVDVDEVQNLEEWDHWAMLPVTAPDGSLLGGLSRAGLRRALNAVFPTAPTAQPESLLAHLFTAYLHTGADLLRLLIGRGLSSPAARARDEV